MQEPETVVQMLDTLGNDIENHSTNSGITTKLAIRFVSKSEPLRIGAEGFAPHLTMTG